MEFHPEDRDLVNFARDRLGERKKERILAHCRECPECADRLLEATRVHAPPPAPLKLTRWNKIWLGALLVSLLLLVVMFFVLLRGIRPPEPQLPPMDGQEEVAPEARG